MLAVVLVAPLALILLGVGLTLHVLWSIVLVLAVVCWIGFFAYPGGRRWYGW
jgi:hypothetical protein